MENYLNVFSSGLYFNAVHAYDNISDSENGTERFGWFEKSLTSSQVNEMNKLQKDISDAGLSALLERSKISKLCYGQRLIYEAEGNGNTGYNYGFSYQYSSAEIIPDGERTVIYASPNANPAPRIIAGNIYENLQHGDLFKTNLQSADDEEWYLKPVVKIPVGTPYEARVFRIDVYNFAGELYDSISVKAGDIKVKGSYTDNVLINGKPILISGSTVDGINKGITENEQQWETNCKIDFKIFWYGETELRFDKLIADDKWGHGLFTGMYDGIIRDEVTAYKQNGWSFTYFTDELVHSQVPCIKYVKEFIASIPGHNIQFTSAISNYLNTRGMKNNYAGHEYYFSEVKPEIFTCDAHVVPWHLPDNIERSTVFKGALFSEPSVYNIELQYNLGFKGDADANHSWGGLVHQVAIARSQSNEHSNSGAPKLIMQPQMQGFMYMERSTGIFDAGGREPTNEEIQVQAMISIAHGADGLCWFIFQSETSPSGSKDNYMAGLLELNGTGYRTRNFYNQDKWGYIANMNKKIANWKPVLDKIYWLEGVSTHHDALVRYIGDIKSYYRTPAPGYELSPSYEDSVKYWELGFFEPAENDNSKYFIAVNRRCIPETNPGTGDLRALQILFKAEELAGFNRWRITDANNGNIIAEFDKASGSYVNIGEFNPGEGRLFKLEPL
jgi:hypothetical protein